MTLVIFFIFLCLFFKRLFSRILLFICLKRMYVLVRTKHATTSVGMLWEIFSHTIFVRRSNIFSPELKKFPWKAWNSMSINFATARNSSLERIQFPREIKDNQSVQGARDLVGEPKEVYLCRNLCATKPAI